MDMLERAWEGVNVFFDGVSRGIGRGLTGFFGSANARHVKKLRNIVDEINGLESRFDRMSDEELRAQTQRFRTELDNGSTLDDILPEAFAVCREAGKRYLNMRHYDVQLIGGMVLHSGSIAEMVTGEGKTLVATLPAYLNAISGKGVHVVTVNDYLARRDMEWMAPLYMGLGLTVGNIQSNMETSARQRSYACDITYGTNNEFGFDYLRDNMRPAARGDDRFDKPLQQSQGPLNYAIIDEVDNILIDEARTPLIISGPASQDMRKFGEADKIARQLKRDEHFKVNEKDHSAHMTEEGVRFAEKLVGVDSFYTAGNMEWPHMLDNSLKAHHLYKKDVNYVIKDGKIVIVDEFTGRLMDGRQWSDGLHQAVEAKERVTIKEETQTLATITLQNFFKLYNKLSGMTGTAMTEANEFWKIYKLDVIAIPTNRGLQRVNHPDVIYRSEREKFNALADEIERIHRFDVVVKKDHDEVWGDIQNEDDSSVQLVPQGEKKTVTISKSDVKEVEAKGRPILVGTVSIEKSETLSRLLEQRGIKHEVLNAKQHGREAEIVAQAGRQGAVTIATNMAGRGTDIVLGGNPETLAWASLQEKYETRLDVPREEWDELVNEIEQREGMKEQGEYLKSIGGLHVIATERHEARRIDLQLRGRCGRQGDPGSSRFFLSLEDDLMRIFAGPFVKKILESLGMQEGERIESKMVTRRIEAAQKKVEERNFEIRKNLLEYDEVMDEQRKRVYGYRQKILNGVNCRDLILDMIGEQIEEHVEKFTDRYFGVESFSKFAQNAFSTEFDEKIFRGLDFDSASQLAHDEAGRMAESHVADAIDENLPEGEDTVDWNWDALARMANARWGLNLRERDLKAAGRESVDTLLVEKARESLDKVELSDGAPYLDEDFGYRSVVDWVKYKFNIEMPLEEIQGKETPDVVAHVQQRAIDEYDNRECEYPVIAGIYKFSETSAGGSRLDRESLVQWARNRFKSDLDLSDLQNKQREEIFEVLVECSRKNQKEALDVIAKVKDKVDNVFGDSTEKAGDLHGSNGKLSSLSDWLREELNCDLGADEMGKMDREALELRVFGAVEDIYRPEIRRMERHVLLEIVDTAWKDHLLMMDRLRSSIGLVGYAQLDAKVEYKREGMRMFGEMWSGIGERSTDLVFRMEQLSEDFVSSTWQETAAVHEQAASTSDIAREQQEAISNSGGGDARIDPIRNRGDRVGRNEPCPCGSGKKFKNCCMRKTA